MVSSRPTRTVQKDSLRLWGFSSAVECLPSKRKALGSILSSEKKNSLKHSSNRWQTELWQTMWTRELSSAPPLQLLTTTEKGCISLPQGWARYLATKTKWPGLKVLHRRNTELTHEALHIYLYMSVFNNNKHRKRGHEFEREWGVMISL